MRKETNKSERERTRISVRLDSDTRSKLEQHREEIKKKTGISASLSEVVASLIRTSL